MSKRSHAAISNGPSKRHESEFNAQSSSRGTATEDEERNEKHYMVHPGDRFDGGRYRVIEELGKGTFGRVVEMWDVDERLTVAVKVVRAISKYSREADIESDILRAVQKTLPRDQSFPIARLLRTFTHEGHKCLVLQRMGPSLYAALKSMRKRREMLNTTAVRDGYPPSSCVAPGHFFSLMQIAHFAIDCFKAIAHLHGLRLTHTDLKLENILFVQPFKHHTDPPHSNDVALIDFGGSTWEEDHSSSTVCTRQYRPPEVTLGTGWSHPIDIWSMGCILAELWTGELLFQTHDEVEHLALMERLLGSLPSHMLRAAAEVKRSDKNFRHGALRWPERAYDRESAAHVRSQPRLKDVLLGARLEARPAGSRTDWSTGLSELYDLLLKCLEFDPADRLKAADALEHPFLKRHVSSKYSTAARYNDTTSFY
mmetsp:Transcript_41228/g.68595  ORF Transcript_41228/g.68595 Transcript_41228/m.68595 type:complete len:426 (-) Transcript_41228:164-1441(-)|eukprot:CAMPEP_0119349476 /NCGR_PEP_ID=MMETSP1333-20130426/107726_1 /TAXON_ID=418940 /ORGANISM="Scyphosphaera apsteinii, Strain RCC1455" /LENGTH=425 /DNA_ID=CAMNT_0007362073 /DNA_START=281 /DNA_END=1558 /DNA_ORIENTATION=-